jgi:hypothetical protein
MERLPKSNVKVYLHARLLSMKGMGQLDFDRFRANGCRGTALLREEERESCAQAWFLWPQKSCHRRSS